MSVPAWYHPLRSDPDLARGLGIVSHLAAIIIAVVLTVIAGLVLGYTGSALQPSGQGLLAAIGLVLSFSVLFSWAGHIPGAFILHALFQRGRAGWAVVIVAGLLVGAGCAVFMGTPLPLTVAPILALLHLFALRWMARLFGRRQP